MNKNSIKKWVSKRYPPQQKFTTTDARNFFCCQHGMKKGTFNGALQQLKKDGWLHNDGTMKNNCMWWHD